MAARINRLTARSVATIAKPGRHADGGNLYLNVSASGARSWVFLYKFAGRQREIGLGSARDVPLARARELAADNRKKLASGTDPLLAKKTPSAVLFGDCADQFICAMESAWRNEKHRAQWRMTLSVYAKALRPIPVEHITTEEVLQALKPLWSTRPETASRLRGRIEAVLNYAKARGLTSGENPARWRGHLDNLLPRRGRLTRGHHAALPIKELPAFIRRLRETRCVSARALEFAILTAARSGEALGAKWSEIDENLGLWTIPAERMKAGREHRVPLSEPAKAVLCQMCKVRQSDYVFPGAKPDCSLSAMALETVLRRAAVKATPHGFRSTFRDWAAEETSFPHEVCEMALAHAIPNKAEAAYRRGDLFQKDAC